MPFEIASIVSLKFLANFVAIFTFYLTLCYLVTKVFSFVISQAYYTIIAPLAALTFAASKKLPSRLRKPARKMHRETRMAEKIIYWTFFFPIFTFMFNFSYLKFDSSTASQLIWICAGVITLAAILKSGIMIRPRTQIPRILDKKRIALRRSLLRDYLYLLAGTGVLISFYTGILRYEKIMNEDMTSLKNEYYQGQAHVLLSNDNAYLLIESSFKKQNFIYLTDKLMMQLPIDLK